MSDKDILKMLAEIVKAVDQDIYTGLFVRPEEPDLAKENIRGLMSIVRKFVR